MQATIQHLKDAQWLISVWKRGMLSDKELYDKIDDLLRSAGLDNWRFQVGLRVGFLELHLMGHVDRHESKLVQISSLLEWIYNLAVGSEDIEKREKLRRVLEKLYDDSLM
jgi:hypothetical protein